ncbi:MAG: glutamate--cysteine ligase, partial [Woeseiaceae bacterium]|nr:glutamate--cysteine ligase [Woeseiaceae bacterium]
YVEVRSLDLNVFDPVGMNQNAMCFTEAFLIYCLLHDSPAIDDAHYKEVQHNHSLTATRGRDPDLRLMKDGREIGLRDWAADIVGDVRAIAELIDQGEGGDAYVRAVDAQSTLVEDADLTPSARVLQDMRENEIGFYHFAMERARGHKAYFQSLAALDDERLALYIDEASQSIKRQHEIEQSDAISFDEYLEKYYSEQGCAD